MNNVAESDLCLFNNIISGAEFSPDRKCRFSLWRIWDVSLPLVMFIGLNPSTANETEVDPTISSAIRISSNNGYGGFYMMNCWPCVATKPKDLIRDPEWDLKNNTMLLDVFAKCKDVVFAWGNFSIVRKTGRDIELKKMFPLAKIIGLNNNGSPKHPLFQKGVSLLHDYNPKVNV